MFFGVLFGNLQGFFGNVQTDCRSRFLLRAESKLKYSPNRRRLRKSADFPFRCKISIAFSTINSVSGRGIKTSFVTVKSKTVKFLSSGDMLKRFAARASLQKCLETSFFFLAESLYSGCAMRKVLSFCKAKAKRELASSARFGNSARLQNFGRFSGEFRKHSAL